MSRVAFTLAGINIYWYSILIVAGILGAIGMMLIEVKKQNMNTEFFLNLAFYVILFGVLGARLYYVLFNLDYYMSDPIEILRIWNGGLAIHGGIFAGILVVVLYCQKYNARLLKTIDIIVVSVIFAQIIGRWGNFFNQEAYGGITSGTHLLSMGIPKFIVKGMFIDGFYHHPTFLYESVWNFVGLIMMLIIRRGKYIKVGFITSFYLIWYSIGRFFIEISRQDSLMLGSIKVAQLASVIMFIAGVGIIIYNKYYKKDSDYYNDSYKDKILY